MSTPFVAPAPQFARRLMNSTAALALCVFALAGCETSQPPPPAPVQTASAGVLAPLPTSLPGGQLTAVGRRAAELRSQAQRLDQNVQTHGSTIQQLRASASDISQRYYSTVAAVNARLQTGTTPGNPILRDQWNRANADLETMNAEVGRLSAMSNQVQGDAAQGASILDSVRGAYAQQGAVDDDHRALRQTEDDVSRTMVVIDRMLAELSDDVRRQTSYVAQERSNLNALNIAITNGALIGPAIGGRPVPLASGGNGAPASGPPRGLRGDASGAVGGRPLVVIRFDRANPSYESELYAAVSQALARRPGASFWVVGVASGRGDQGETAIALAAARRQAEQVYRSLGSLGVSSDRVRLSQTTSTSAASNEVHLYVF
jgi:hypothetical protein